MSQVEVRIPFTAANIAKCMCSMCPVQEGSQCVNDLLSYIGPAVYKEKSQLKSEEVPGLYCGTGPAACHDLEPKKGCICSTCKVFAEYKLGNWSSFGYYCKNGVDL